MGRVALWAVVGLLAGVPLVLATQSPFLAWREPIYIAAGLTGIAAMGLLLVQTVLGTDMSGQPAPRARRIHRFVGASVAALVLAHVAGLWITSPPDVLDALLFRSPTPFAPWGVVAMWALIATAVLAAFRRRLRFRLWRRAHLALAIVVIVGTVVHVVLIEGTMEPASKYLLSAALLWTAQQKGRGKPRPLTSENRQA